MSDLPDTDADRQAAFAEVRASRGYLLPLHELLGAVDPDLLRRYDAFATQLLFGEEPRHLDLKTRYLVLLGITTTAKGDREGIEWSMRRAQEHGATREECLEAISLAALPAGTPAVEFAALAIREVDEGKGWVEDGPRG